MVVAKGMRGSEIGRGLGKERATEGVDLGVPVAKDVPDAGCRGSEIGRVEITYHGLFSSACRRYVGR